MPTKGYQTISKIKITGYKAYLASGFCFTLFLFSFVFPLSQMIFWIFKFPESLNFALILELTFNTMTVVILTTGILIMLAFFTNYGMRISNSKILNFITNFSVSGYAIPGVIMAVSLLSFITFVSNIFKINWISYIFVGSLLSLITAYTVRFYSLAINGIKSGYEKLNTNLDDASYLMGYSKFGTFLKVHLPF